MEDLSRQIPKFTIAYTIVFLAIIFNSILIKVNIDLNKSVHYIGLLIENILLCGALLLFCAFHALMVDAIGQDFYEKQCLITNIYLIMLFIGAILCLVNICTVIFSYIKRYRAHR